MKPTRRTQPYRRGLREPSHALTAMLRGRTPSGWNPADVQRRAQKLSRPWWQGNGRPKRPARPARPQRPPR